MPGQTEGNEKVQISKQDRENYWKLDNRALQKISHICQQSFSIQKLRSDTRIQLYTGTSFQILPYLSAGLLYSCTYPFLVSNSLSLISVLCIFRKGSVSFLEFAFITFIPYKIISFAAVKFVLAYILL